VLTSGQQKMAEIGEKRRKYGRTPCRLFAGWAICPKANSAARAQNDRQPVIGRCEGAIYPRESMEIHQDGDNPLSNRHLFESERLAQVSSPDCLLL